MLSFWDTKDKKSKTRSRYERPVDKEKKDIKKEKEREREKEKERSKSFSNKPEKKANVTILENDKEIGRTTVIKKPQTSGFWVEKPSIDAENGNSPVSSVALKRENFLTESDSFEHENVNEKKDVKIKSEIETLHIKVTEQGQQIQDLISKLATLEDNFQESKKQTIEVFRALTQNIVHIQNKDKKKEKNPGKNYRKKPKFSI